jgi:hypothetical protein
MDYQSASDQHVYTSKNGSNIDKFGVWFMINGKGAE